MSKWCYIEKISVESDKYGDKLVELMEKYNVINLQEITYNQAKEFWEVLENELG